MGEGARKVVCVSYVRGAQHTLVAVNTGNADQTLPFWFPVGGDYVVELHDGDLDLHGIVPLQEMSLTIPSHYRRIWDGGLERRPRQSHGGPVGWRVRHGRNTR